MRTYNRFMNQETGEYEVTIIVGLTKEIEASVKALYRHAETTHDADFLAPAFTERPKYDYRKGTYGIFIDNVSKEFSVITGDVALMYIIEKEEGEY